jgi:hypothetical protein
MKLIAQVLSILIGIGFASIATAANVSDCKANCQKIRRELLNDVSSSVCKKASNIAPIPKLFQSCIDGRKRGFEQCVSYCLSGEPTVDSFDGCKASKGNAARPNMMQASHWH